MSKLSASSVRSSIKTVLYESSLEASKAKNDDGSNAGKKRNFIETIELQIGLKNYDPQRDKRFSGTVKLPHVPRPRMSLCILADAAHVDQAKQIDLEYMTVEDLKKCVAEVWRALMRKDADEGFPLIGSTRTRSSSRSSLKSTMLSWLPKP